VYGPAAERDYRRSVRQRFAATLAHPQVDALAWTENGAAAGIVWSTSRDDVGYIGFVHVLSEHAGRGIEDKLLAQAVANRRQEGVRAIVCESLTFARMDLARAFGALGFDRVQRLIMVAPLSTPALALEGPVESVPCTRECWRDAAAVIADAYRDHPDRRIHPDVHSVDSCEAFVTNAARGSYGYADEAYVRAILRDGRVAGTVLGCEVAPETGFVLQVAVRPEFQGIGIGARILRELAEEFRKTGLKDVALGVTAANPAKRLYERLGFEPRRPVDTYIWWRNPEEQRPASR
jgi:ribosomal protein S18 acetylase RimI-like enzyme